MQSETEVSVVAEGASPQVYGAICRVSQELSHAGISKDRSNQQQGYKFRGIDDCLNAISSLLPKYGLVIIPTVLEREVVERQTKSGGALFYVTVKVQFSFVSVQDGSQHLAVLYGEAMDSADKATNKAMSAAYKYAVLLTFCIPTEGDNDADATTHEVAAKQNDDIKAVQAKLAQAKPTPAQPPTQAQPAQPVPVACAESAFVWQIGKTHGGKRIEDIPLDYLEWYVQNGKKQDHLEACKAELGRVACSAEANQPKISALCEAYLEGIMVSETVSECQKAIEAALSDENINVFEGQHLKDTGERKLALLRQ